MRDAAGGHLLVTLLGFAMRHVGSVTMHCLQDWPTLQTTLKLFRELVPCSPLRITTFYYSLRDGPSFTWPDSHQHTLGVRGKESFSLLYTRLRWSWIACKWVILFFFSFFFSNPVGRNLRNSGYGELCEMCSKMTLLKTEISTWHSAIGLPCHENWNHSAKKESLKNL